MSVCADRTDIIALGIDPLNEDEAVNHLLNGPELDGGGYVCHANVHMTMEAYDDEQFQQVVRGARLVTPDGMPLVWMLRALGRRKAKRVYGPGFMLRMCQEAERHGLPIALFGGTDESLRDFVAFLTARFPNLSVASVIAPPFRPLTEQEEIAYCGQIRTSGARLVFVGIGCPKQERWMARNTERLPGLTLFGVGAAFDFHSGRVRQAPALIQRLGLEWLFRLVLEPRRLWKRYMKHNPRFVALALRQLAFGRAGPAARHSTKAPMSRA